MCPYCQDPQGRVVKKGFFVSRAGRTRHVQRYRCCLCRKSFSEQTSKLTYRERKPEVDQPLFRLLCHGVSQRSAAIILGIHPVTVARKLCRMGPRARALRQADNATRACTQPVVFDEMETFEHSKCKPLSIAVAVEEKSRRILAAEVAQMPAKGPLAAISRRRYGRRLDRRPVALTEMFRQIQLAAPGLTLIKSDESPRYPRWTQKLFPHARHATFKGRRGCVVGQGELKRGGFDPLFSLNHTCAMNRDRLKRLSRRTWCTTKRPDRLQMLLDLYSWYHNQALSRPRSRPSLWLGPNPAR